LIAAPTLFLVMMVHVFGHVATLRRRRIKPAAISLFGLHGEVAFNEYDAKAGDRIAIAWSGVGAQVVVMLLAVAANIFIPFQEIPFALLVWGPMYFIFTKFNILLLIVALLPSGRSMATTRGKSSAHAQVDAAPASSETRARSGTRARAGAHARRAARARRKLAAHGGGADFAPVAQIGRTDPGSLKPMLWSERTVWPYRYRRGDSPLIVSMPHAGTFVPHSVGRHLDECAACRCDTDWHLRG
jgi:hypothetical protein